jgi:hypothetical protein
MTFTRGKMAVFALAALALTATPNASDAWAQNDRPNKQSPSPASRSLQQRLIGQSQDDDAGLAKSTLSTPSPNAPLIGRWRQRDEIAERELVFLPDGRYFIKMVFGGAAPLSQKGRYEIHGSTLRSQADGEQPVEYNFGVQGGQLLVTGGPLGSLTLRYAKEPGSEQAVLKEARQLDARKAADDEAWRQRIPAGPLQPGRIMGAGEVPQDQNFARVFPGATVFKEQEAYIWFSSFTRQLTNLSGSYSYSQEFRDNTKWFFFPNGRCFAKFTNYLGATTTEGNITAAWGAYRLEGVGTGAESLSIETDAGEKISMQVIDGRRNLQWTATTYGNVEWENEALNNYLNQ